jgi:hypothetical protein
MIEDYYKILNLHPNVGLYKIARHFKTIANKSLTLIENSEDDKKYFFEVNRAFEILKNEQSRKYYDILYKIFILEKNSKISDLTIQKYVKIVNDSSLKGNHKAERLIDDSDYLDRSAIRQSLIFNFISNCYKIVPANKIIFGPLFGFIYFIIGFIFLIKQFWGLDASYLATGTVLFTLSLIIIYFNFRQYTIDLMNEE